MTLFIVVSAGEYNPGYEVGVFSSREVAEQIASLDSTFVVVDANLNEIIGKLFPSEKHEEAVRILRESKIG